MIAVKQFTSAEEMREHYRALQVRMSQPRQTKRPALIVVPKEAEPLVAKFREVKPLPQERALQPVAVARRIIADVALKHEVSVKQILGDDRQAPVIEARREAMSLVYRANPNWSLVKMGRFFNRDHTTILHALRKTGDRS